MDDASETILLLEGDPATATAVLAALTAHNHSSVDHVTRLADGIARLEQSGVAGIVLNLFLPDSQGIDTLDAVRAVAGHTPIVVIGQADDHDLGALALARGAEDVLPDGQFDGNTLGRAVTRMLERHAEDNALFIERERAEVTLNSIGDAVLSTDIEGRVTYLNAVAERLTGWSRRDAAGRPIEEILNIIDEVSRAPSANPMALVVRDNKTVTLNGVLIRRDGREFPIEDSAAPIHDRRGRITGGVIVFRDVSAARRSSLQLSHLAQHDFLTGLPNRMLLKDRLQQATALAERHSYRVAILFLDLDRFKPVNDSLGHAVGDRLLEAVATRLTGAVRRSDTVGRYGGDEFVVILSEITGGTNHAEVSVAKLLAVLSAPYQIGRHKLHVPVSIGVSLYPDDGKEADILVGNADVAMYQAKTHGGGNYKFFTRDMVVINLGQTRRWQPDDSPALGCSD